MGGSVSARAAPDDFLSRDKVVCCAQLGRIEEARRWLGHLLELQPGLTITVYKAYAASFFPPEMTALHVEGLRKAGLPEE